MSFFGHLLTGAASGYAKGAMDDLQDREAMASRLALLQQQQQDKMELQRQRAEDSRALREMSMAQGGRRGSGGGDGTNVFEVLMDAVRVCSLGQITNALFEVGGQYRRNM